MFELPESVFERMAVNLQAQAETFHEDDRRTGHPGEKPGKGKPARQCAGVNDGSPTRRSTR